MAAAQQAGYFLFTFYTVISNDYCNTHLFWAPVVLTAMY